MEEKKKTAREIIEGYDGPPVRIMEVCGTHTHEIFRLGIRKLLPEQVELISGPGCPVCVTQVGFIDEAIYLALERQVTICTFGDLVRVPGTNMSLAGAREKGAKIRIVYSPVDAKEYAKEHPKEQVTFLSVGFETTTPSACLSVKKAREEGLTNYSILTANKTMPQAYEALKGSADIFLYPGHVNAITGTKLCEELAKEDDEHDKEGRLITLEYDNFYLVTCYTPNSQNELMPCRTTRDRFAASLTSPARWYCSISISSPATRAPSAS